MKKFLSLFFAIILSFTLWLGAVHAEVGELSIESLHIGDYIVLGQYNDTPLLWRYIDEDENGKLMLTKNVLCDKPFGFMREPYYDENNNICWKDSFIRFWLNSDVDEQEIDWELYVSKTNTMFDYFDATEKGFLHESNFSKLEKMVMKPTAQWTMLPSKRIQESENGIYDAFNGVKLYIPGNPRDGGHTEFYDITELPKIYYGAAYQTTDTVFLLDEMQVYHMWENLGDIKAVPLDKEKAYSNGYHPYLLRSPGYLIDCCGLYNGMSGLADGVRPAFYLDEENAVILSGSGTEEDPYVIAGKTDEDEVNNSVSDDNATENESTIIKVFCNGSEIFFDQLPFMENERVLVPMRAIFESLGATVNWDESTQTITSTSKNNTIVMQIGNKIITKNGEPIESEVEPKIVGDRTFVPIRDISESLDATVTWDESTLTVTVIKEL